MREWTIMVFLNAKNNLEQFAFPNFEQIASIGSTPEVQVVVEMGRPKHHFSTPEQDAQFGKWSKVLRFAIDKGTRPVEAEAVQDLGAANMGDAKTLGEFVTWAREKYPSKKTMLVIWNHGQGWRRDEEDAAPAKAAGPSAVRYVSNDDDTGDKLYNRAIQDELTHILAGTKLDVIAFDACLMAMVETAYALRNVAKVMVGSEELEPGTGWDYTSWLKALVDAKGEADAVGLGKLMVSGYEATYGDLDDTTLSAIDLDRADELGRAITNFATAAQLKINSEKAAFKKARFACLNYAPGYNLHSVDLGRFMLQIAKESSSAPVRTAAAKVSVELDRCVIQSYASRSRQGSFGSHGLGIYFPKTGSAFRSDFDGDAYVKEDVPFPVEFVQKERWDSFLKAYWKVVP